MKKGLLARLSSPMDLTQGTPWKKILRYALPIILSYLLQQIYVLTDAIICGQVLTSAQVAGVNDTFPLTFIFLQFAFGCTAGFSVVTGEAVGKGDTAGVRRSFASQFFLSFVLSVLLTAVSILLLPWLLGSMHLTPESGEVYRAAYDYCFVIFLGIFAQMGYNFVCGILRAYGDSVTPLFFLVFSTVLNVGLDLFFLSVLKMGPIGAAAATVIAQLISFIACTAYTFFKYPQLRLKIQDLKPDASALWEHLRQGLPLGLQFSVLAIGIIVMQGAVVKFDLTESGAMVASTPAQNGYGAASKLFNFLMSVYNGLGSAILGYNAQNYGKSAYDRIRRGTVQTLGLMLAATVLCVGIGLLMTIGGAYQYIFMSADKISSETIRYGNIFLYMDFAFYPVLGFLIVVRSAVQGVFFPGYVLGAGVAELVARVVLCTWLPAWVNGAPVDCTASSAAFAAVCFGDPGAWICASVVLAIPLCGAILKERYKKAAL